MKICLQCLRVFLAQSSKVFNIPPINQFQWPKEPQVQVYQSSSPLLVLLFLSINCLVVVTGFLTKAILRTNKMAQQVKGLAAKSGCLSLIPRIHTVKGGN